MAASITVTAVKDRDSIFFNIEDDDELRRDTASALVFVGFFSINVTSLANTMLQLESVPAMRGRVLARERKR